MMVNEDRWRLIPSGSKTPTALPQQTCATPYLSIRYYATLMGSLAPQTFKLRDKDKYLDI
ncbi:MAG: hypothetical protein PVI97_14585 [Candidatus Thiodiazotropha sp.]|jgi:hypothetical protein